MYNADEVHLDQTIYDRSNDIDNIGDSGEVSGMNIDVVTEGGDIVDNEMCVFKRGVCTTHNIKGNKMTVNTKKWKKEKYGYGWVTAQRRRLNILVLCIQDYSVSIDDCKSPVMNIGDSIGHMGSSPGISGEGLVLRNSNTSLKGKVTQT